MLIRRARGEPGRFTRVRVALFFLAAGLWLGGVIAGNRLATGVAIGILLVAVALGAVGRGGRGDPSPPSPL